MTKLTLQEQLKLASETAVSARGFYEIWWFYKNDESRKAIIDTMNRFSQFFRAGHRAHFYALILHLAVLFDKDNRSASLGNLLDASCLAGADVSKVAEAQAIYDGVVNLGRRLFVLRNNVFAHLTARMSEKEAFAKASIKADDLGRLTNDCIAICNKLLAANGLREVSANQAILPHTEELLEALKSSLGT